MRKVNNWDDWIDYFGVWQDTIGMDRKEVKQFNFEVLFGAPEEKEIEFGHYKGQNKWKTLMHIPDQRIRDSLLNLIVYQGDTEFASVEQQRNLLHNAPSDYDLQSILRVMCEEVGGWFACRCPCAPGPSFLVCSARACVRATHALLRPLRG